MPTLVIATSGGFAGVSQRLLPTPAGCSAVLQRSGETVPVLTQPLQARAKESFLAMWSISANLPLL